MGRAHAHSPVGLPRHWRRPALRGRGLAVLVQRGAGLLALAVTIAFVALILSAGQQREDARAVAQSTETVRQIGLVEKLAVDLESSIRGYVITGQEPFLAPYWDARARWPQEAGRLVALVSDRPAQAALAGRLQQEGDDYATGYADRLIARQRRSGHAAIDIVAS